MVVYLSGGTWFNHVNNLNSTTMYTSQNGAAVGDQVFYPWGDAWLYWGSGGYNFADLDYYDTSTTTALTPFRVFSPNIGRWHSPDPLGGDAGWRRAKLCVSGGNPVYCPCHACRETPFRTRAIAVYYFQHLSSHEALLEPPLLLRFRCSPAGAARGNRLSPHRLGSDAGAVSLTD